MMNISNDHFSETRVQGVDLLVYLPVRTMRYSLAGGKKGLKRPPLVLKQACGVSPNHCIWRQRTSWNFWKHTWFGHRDTVALRVCHVTMSD